MTDAWRTMQIFLSEDGIFEVEMDAAGRAFRCNCPEYSVASACRHSKFMLNKVTKTKGVLSIEIPDSVEDEDVPTLETPADKFREFVLKYGRVEVL